MILTVTDAKELTRKVESKINNAAVIKGYYTELFSNHVSKITDNTFVKWSFIKTTGDGLVIISEPQPGCQENKNFFDSWLKVTYDLFYDFVDPVPIRVVAHWFEEKRVFKGLGIDWKAVSKSGQCISDLDGFGDRLRSDIFGPEVNLAFRILGLISGTVFVITENLMSKLAGTAQENEVANEDFFTIDNFEFGPRVPITYLKGIDRYGFTEEGQNGPKKTPLWLWEVSKCQEKV